MYTKKDLHALSPDHIKLGGVGFHFIKIQTQTESEQLARTYKAGACPRTNRKHKMEGLEEGDSREKMSKITKLETQTDTSNGENKENVLFSMPTAKQTEITALNEPKEKHTITTKTHNVKQNWDEMIEEETEKFKDITNTVNPWVDANLDEPQGEKYDIVEETKSDNLNDENPKGLEGLPEDCFFDNIEEMLGLSDHETPEQPTSRWDRSNTRQNATNPPKEKAWSSLFPKLKRGRSTYTSFSPRKLIKSKNENALIIDISGIQSSFNEIMESLFNTVKYDICASKQQNARGRRTHLEVVFKDRDTLKQYAARGIEIMKRTYYGHIPVDARKTFMSIKCRNVQLGNKNKVSDALVDAFSNVRKIVAIKPLLIEGTPYISDQWIITFESTDDSDLEARIPRFTHVWDNKVTTEWRSAAKVCYFCEATGHIKKDCQQFHESVALRREFYRRRNSNTTEEETEVTDEPEQVISHEQTEMHTDEVIQDVQTKPEEAGEEKETDVMEEAATPPIAASPPSREEFLPTEMSAAPSVPMVYQKRN